MILGTSTGIGARELVESKFGTTLVESLVRTEPFFKVRLDFANRPALEHAEADVLLVRW